MCVADEPCLWIIFGPPDDGDTMIVVDEMIVAIKRMIQQKSVKILPEKES